MARRRRKSEIEDLLDLASILPWWLGLTIAVLSYALLHPLAETPVPTATSPGEIAGPFTAQVIRTGAVIGLYLLPVAFLLGAAVCTHSVGSNAVRTKSVSFALRPRQPTVMRVYVDEGHVDNNI